MGTGRRTMDSKLLTNCTCLSLNNLSEEEEEGDVVAIVG